MHAHNYGHSIVLIGNFNPKIFHPAWFSAQGLIGKKEEEGAKIEIVHSDLSLFSADWLSIEVLHDRFKASTTQQPYSDAVRDLVLGTFTILRHTPLTMMGINIEKHFRVNSEDIWHKAGRKLAPKEPWEGLINEPGMLSLTMQGQRSDTYKGFIRVTAEPSRKVRPGLFFQVNDHYEAADRGNILGSDEIVSILKASWQTSCKNADVIISGLYERITTQ